MTVNSSGEYSIGHCMIGELYELKIEVSTTAQSKSRARRAQHDRTVVSTRTTAGRSHYSCTADEVNVFFFRSHPRGQKRVDLEYVGSRGPIYSWR